MTGPYTLLDAAGHAYPGRTPGRFGGHRRLRVYGRLDCPSALRAIAAGGYVPHRVFFADEATAVAAGYRPCAVCLPARYAVCLPARYAVCLPARYAVCLPARYAAWRHGRRPVRRPAPARTAPGETR